VEEDSFNGRGQPRWKRTVSVEGDSFMEEESFIEEDSFTGQLHRTASQDSFMEEDSKQTTTKGQLQ
jgi:hypothetical protein